MFFDIIIPTYKVSIERLKRCLDSVVNQTFQKCRIWVCDGTPQEDHLYDKMRDLLEAEYPQVNYLRQTGIGVGQARNQAVEAGSSPYVAFLDADDWWDLDWLENAHQAIISQDSERVAIYVGGGRGKKKLKSQMSGRVWEIDIFYHQQDYESWIHPFHKAYIRQSPIFPSFSIVERERFMEVGGFKEAIGIYEDTILFCEMCGDMTVENSFKVKKIHSFAGTKDNHDECSAFGGNQSGMFDRDGESHKQVAREVAEKYLHFDVSPILNSQMDDETKSALCEFRFEREFQIHL